MDRMAKDKGSKKKLPKSLEEQRTRMVCSDRNYNVRTPVAVLSSEAGLLLCAYTTAPPALVECT